MESPIDADGRIGVSRGLTSGTEELGLEEYVEYVRVIGPCAFRVGERKKSSGAESFLGACGGVDKRIWSLLSDLFWRRTVTLKRT